MVWREESCHLRKCLIILGIDSSRLVLTSLPPSAGEHKCLKREFLRLTTAQIWRQVGAYLPKATADRFLLWEESGIQRRTHRKRRNADKCNGVYIHWQKPIQRS
jgi:hypothetical protein